ncbi:MAG: 50S ribosomal protein L17 [bacterium]|nr:50S ribosomal protein L17 [bacterium]
MQHRQAGKKLGRTVSHRRALFRNLIRAMIISEKIVTTETKAKAVRPIIEKLITTARTNDLAHLRLAMTWVPDKTILKKLVSTIAPRYITRPGGYTRIIKLGRRAGDAAPIVQLEFVGIETSTEAKDKDKGRSTKS